MFNENDIIQVHKSDNYVAMSVYHFREKDMSLKAKGLLSFLLALPSDWECSTRNLENYLKECKNTINSVLQELEDFGYVEREQQRGEQGKMSHTRYIVRERPLTENDNSSAENPENEEVSDSPCTKNCDTVKTLEFQQNPIFENQPCTKNWDTTKTLEFQGVSKNPQSPCTKTWDTAEPLKSQRLTPFSSQNGANKEGVFNGQKVIERKKNQKRKITKNHISLFSFSFSDILIYSLSKKGEVKRYKANTVIKKQKQKPSSFISDTKNKTISKGYSINKQEIISNDNNNNFFEEEDLRQSNYINNINNNLLDKDSNNKNNKLVSNNTDSEETSNLNNKAKRKKSKDRPEFSEQVKEIVDYLNEQTGKHYLAKSKKTRELISARMDDDFTVEDFKRVIWIKTQKWLDTSMDDYLRPVTLFGTKFEDYLNEREITEDEKRRREGKMIDFTKLDF